MSIQEFIFPDVPSHLCDDIAAYLQQQYAHFTPNIYFKDVHAVYQWCNLAQLSLFHYNDVSGLSLIDLFDKKTANQLEQVDRQVVSSGNRMIFIEEGPYPNGSYTKTLSIKQPLKSDVGEILGMIGFSVILHDKQVLQEQFFARTKQNGLSKQQSECLYFLMQGYSAKEIALHMHISFRTVESYLDVIKNKLNCIKKSDLINLAFSYYSN